jgi:hypothetical protein
VFEFFVRTEFEGANVTPDPISGLGFFFERYQTMLILIGYLLVYILVAGLMLRFTTKALKN